MLVERYDATEAERIFRIIRIVNMKFLLMEITYKRN